MMDQHSFASPDDTERVLQFDSTTSDKSESPPASSKILSEKTRTFINAIEDLARESGATRATTFRPPAFADLSPPINNLLELQARSRADLRRYMYPRKHVVDSEKLRTEPILIGQLIEMDLPVMHISTSETKAAGRANAVVTCEACYSPDTKAKFSPCNHAVCDTCLSFSLVNASASRKVSRCMACGTRVNSFNIVRSFTKS